MSFAHVSPTVPATLAAAIGISLAVFLLPGAALQGEPAPLIPAIAGATGRIAADLPIAAPRPASEPARKAFPVARPAATRTEQVAPQRRHAVTKTHRAHPRARTRVVRQPVPAAPPQAAAPAAPATPVTTVRWSSAPAAKGKARGHGHGRATRSTAGPDVRPHGHGRALGRSTEHHHGSPPGRAKKTAPAAPAPAAPPKAEHGGNGHKGGKK